MAALKEGYPQAQVKAILDERFKNLAYRRDVAVGNNMYANMTEELLDPKPENQENIASKNVLLTLRNTWQVRSQMQL